MSRTTKLVLAAAAAGVLAVAVGASGAVAVSRALGDDVSEAVIEDAAEELGVEPEALSDALKEALQNQVDEAVDSGRLTEEHGERLKQRIESGEVPFFGFPRIHGLGLGPGHHGVFASLDTAAEYLGVEARQLRERLQDGETLAEIARDEGKSVDGLVDALVDAASGRIDEAVDEGRLDEDRADELKERLEGRFEDLVNGELRFRDRGLRRGDRFDVRPEFGFRGGPPPPFAGPRA